MIMNVVTGFVRFLKGLFNFLMPWPMKKSKPLPWISIHAACQGASGALIYIATLVLLLGPLFDFVHKYVFTRHMSPFLVLGELCLGAVAYLYLLLLAYRFYKLMWRFLDPWFESKYKKDS